MDNDAAIMLTLHECNTVIGQLQADYSNCEYVSSKEFLAVAYNELIKRRDGLEEYLKERENANG